MIASARSANFSANARSSATPRHGNGQYAERISVGEDTLQQETTELLSQLIRFNTVNPPGNERPAIEHLEHYLGEAGFETDVLGSSEERANLVATLHGQSDGPTLLYLGHVDTVLADSSEWTHDPWSGDVADGFLWGRGSLDMKSQVAAEAAAAASLARDGWRPAQRNAEAGVRGR